MRIVNEIKAMLAELRSLRERDGGPEWIPTLEERCLILRKVTSQLDGGRDPIDSGLDGEAYLAAAEQWYLAHIEEYLPQWGHRILFLTIWTKEERREILEHAHQRGVGEDDE